MAQFYDEALQWDPAQKAWKGGIAENVTALTDAAAISVNPFAGDIFTLTPAGNDTLNMQAVRPGQEITFVITTNGTTSYTLTFGTNFKSTGTLATGTVSGKVFTITFRSDGVNYNEVARSTAM